MDPNQNQYIADPAIRVLSVCQSVFRDYAKTFKLGVPSLPLTDLDYPAVIVQKLQSNMSIGATMTDNKIERLSIIVLTNKADEAGGPNDPGITTIRKLENMIEGEEASTINSPDSYAYDQYQTSTLVYQLRRQLTLSGITINNAIEVQYDMEARGEDTNGSKLPALVQATIIMTLTRKIIIPTRD